MSPAEARDFLAPDAPRGRLRLPALQERRERSREAVGAWRSRAAAGVVRGASPRERRRARRARTKRLRWRWPPRSSATSGTRRRTTWSRGMFADAVEGSGEGARREGRRSSGRSRSRRERMGGLLAVNRGAAEEPRFVVLEYRGGKKGEAPVVLVGKGVTFDSGGISIKPADRMGDMKWDMMGAATACGAVLAAADLGLPVNVVALAPADGEHAVGVGLQAGRRRDVPEREDGRDRQHRRRGAGRPGRRPRLREGVEAGGDRRLRHAHRRGASSRSASRRRSSSPTTTTSPPRSSRPASGRTSGSGGSRSGTTTGRTSAPTGPTSRTRAAGTAARSTGRSS